MLEILIILISMFLAVNMGASGFSISFAPSYACNLLSRRKAVIFYSIFVLLGAVLIGKNVVTTLTDKLVVSFINQLSGLIILIAASLTLFTANILKIPQSTSFVMVGAFTGSGIYYGRTNLFKLGEIFFVAIIFSIAAFFLTYFLCKVFYPPGKNNFRIYEIVMLNQNKLKNFILFTDCYSAFAVGTNNVPNVVAPLLISGSKLSPLLLLLLYGPIFGFGGLLFGKGNIHTISKDIIPLGEISSGIVSLVTSSFVIIASLLGLPTPYVQFATFSIIGISVVKDGLRITSEKFVVKKILFVWIILPIVTAILSYITHRIFLG